MAPIHTAIWNGNLEEVKRLIQQDPEVVHRRDMNAYTPLYYASREGHVEVAACLLYHGARINQESAHEGCTPCNVACWEGHPELVELLLAQGADPTIPSCNGTTPLMMAAREGHGGVVRCLLRDPRVMSTINHRNDSGWTALYWACSFKGDADVVRLLLEAGADPTIASNIGVTPVVTARQQAHDACVELLEEWERVYLLTKARRLRDASHDDDDVSQSLFHQRSFRSSCSTAKVSRIKSILTYLMGHVVKGQSATMEVADEGGRGEVEEGLLVKVVEYVVGGALKGDLFVELMELMGRTG